MKTEDLGIKLPVVVDFDVAKLEPDGIVLQLKYAATRKRYSHGELDTILYGFPRSLANELLKLLQKTLK